jgi:3-phenylpropionate/trans-cinnamate dioxygenase ferredoxin subunit
MSEPVFHPVVGTNDLPSGGAVPFDVAGQSILICYSKDRYFAVASRCSHADESLECGKVRAGWIACPVHGARFDLETGQAMNPPAKEPIRTYPLRVVEGIIEVAV